MKDSLDAHIAVWSRELDRFDPVKEAIIVRLAMVSRYVSQVRRDALDSDGLAHWEFKVLLNLRRLGPPYTASPSELADLLGLTRGALSARLGPMEDAGLVTRTTDAGDRRRVHVRLTPAGSTALVRHLDAEDVGEGALLATLTARERETLAELLRKLVVAVEDAQRGGTP